jgi:hypothetical protein
MNFPARNRLKMKKYSHGYWSGQPVWLVVMVMGRENLDLNQNQDQTRSPDQDHNKLFKKRQHFVNIFSLSTYEFPMGK